MDVADKILGLCGFIYNTAENAKANKDRCQRVAKRVKALEELVLTIIQRGLCQFSTPVSNALRELHQTLLAAKALIVKYTETKSVMKFLKAGGTEEKFAKINERLNDSFQILSGALQIEQGDTLNKMCHTLTRCSTLDAMDGAYGSQAALMSQDSVSSPTAPMPLMSPTTSTPLPMITPASPVTSPTAPPMTVMPLMSPTTSTPPRMITPASPVTSPTAPTMTVMPLMSPTTSTPPRMIRPAIPVTSPTALASVPGGMPPMSSGPIIPMPTPSFVPVNNPTFPMNFSRPVAPSPFSPTVVSQPYSNTVYIPPKPVIRTVAPVAVRPIYPASQMYVTNTPQVAVSQTTQAVVTTYVVNKPF